ncbi:MAG TPA: HNH endonuclease [Deinococcales bacterium]|nr:HNH endonuclease [Deinococcales bacterium]
MKAANPYPRVWQKGKAIRVHRLVAEAMVRRPLARGEVVHHLNGDKDDCRPLNIRVLPSQRHHMVLEHYQRFEAQGVPHLFDLETVLQGLE